MKTLIWDRTEITLLSIGMDAFHENTCDACVTGAHTSAKQLNPHCQKHNDDMITFKASYNTTATEEYKTNISAIFITNRRCTSAVHGSIISS